MDKKFLLILLGCLILITGGYLSTKKQNYPSFKQDVFNHLKDQKEKKKQRILQYLTAQETSAEHVKTDPLFLKSFAGILDLYENPLKKKGQFQTLNNQMIQYFLKYLGAFYDALFINPEGTIFYSIKKESDLYKNIHSPLFSRLALNKAVSRLKDQILFVDYEYYAVSQEPASFYIVPLNYNGNSLGTLVLQLSLNSINQILTEREDLGQTGEVYLINNRRLMMSESRFLSRSNMLTKRVDTDAVKESFQKGLGEKILMDYRKKRVFSSFERFKYNETSWIIVAEMDEDEVISNYYLEYEEYLFGELAQTFKTPNHMSQEGLCHNHMESASYEDFIKVDFQEFQKTKDGKKLVTKGIATCTAIGVYLPKKFGYLLHLSPTDGIYDHSAPVKWWLMDNYTERFDLVLNQMEHFDIYPSEKSLVKFQVVATHLDSLKNSVKKILKRGYFLSQITPHILPYYKSVDVQLDYLDGKTIAKWHSGKPGPPRCTTIEQKADLATIVGKLIET